MKYENEIRNLKIIIIIKKYRRENGVKVEGHNYVLFDMDLCKYSIQCS